MDGEQTHRQRIHCRGRQHAPGLEGTHKGIGRGETPAAQLQRDAKQRAQIGQHRVALVGGRRRAEARQHVAVAIDGLQRVMWRPLAEPAFPLD